MPDDPKLREVYMTGHRAGRREGVEQTKSAFRIDPEVQALHAEIKRRGEEIVRLRYWQTMCVEVAACLIKQDGGLRIRPDKRQEYKSLIGKLFSWARELEDGRDRATAETMRHVAENPPALDISIPFHEMVEEVDQRRGTML